jgi:O-antigen/teichoic acid export membrane protein
LRPTFSKAATRDLSRFSAASYLGSLLGTLPMWVLPLVILSRFGPSESAYWYTAMAIASLLSQIPGSVARVLLVEVVHSPAERRDLMRNAAKVMTVITVPVFVVAYLAALLVLTLFGPHYVSGSLAALRWLIAAGLVSAVNYLARTVILLAKKPSVLAYINAINAVIVLGLSATWARNVRDVAICWFIGQIPSTALFALFAFRSLRQVRGRWEDLGGDRPNRLPLAADPRPPGDAQLAGLEVLLSLAGLQGVESFCPRSSRDR